MSCSMVHTDLIDLLVTAAVKVPFPNGPLTWWHDGDAHQVGYDADTPDRVGAMLLAETMRSVNYRYSEDEVEPVYVHRPVDSMPPAVHVLAAVDCYEFQSCEHPGWEQSEAWRFCNSLTRCLVVQLPGFDAAPWHWTRDAAANARSAQ